MPVNIPERGQDSPALLAPLGDSWLRIYRSDCCPVGHLHRTSEASATTWRRCRDLKDTMSWLFTNCGEINNERNFRNVFKCILCRILALAMLAGVSCIRVKVVQYCCFYQYPTNVMLYVDAPGSGHGRVESVWMVGRHEQNSGIWAGHPINGIQQSRQRHVGKACICEDILLNYMYQLLYLYWLAAWFIH